MAYERKTMWVNAYEVTREYGGPEEGGWYYNDHQCIDSKRVYIDKVNETEEEFRNEYDYLNEGNIYSVLGGSELAVYVERKEAESQTTGRPHYE